MAEHGKGTRALKHEANQVDSWSFGLVWLMPVAVLLVLSSAVAVYLVVLDRRR
jgi:hypothetical protein